MKIVEIIEELLPIVYPFKVVSVEKDESNQEVHIHLTIEKSYAAPAGHKVHQYYNRTWEHVNLFQYRCFLHCRVPIYKDEQTGKTKALEISFSRPNSRFTILFEHQVMELMKLYHCPTKVAEQLKLYPQRISDIYHFYTQSSYENHQVNACERIGIDETSTRKGHNYISAFVDLDTSQIIDIQDGRGSDVIEKFFHEHPYPPIVKDISVDMSPAFSSGIESFFPWAKITFDKWHVFRLLGKHLDKIYRKFKSPYVTILHEHLREFYQSKSINDAKAHLNFIADFAEQQFGKNSFSKSIRRHFDGIVEQIRSKINNGILEGINSKIQTIKRVAKGFRIIDNFKKMILFVFGVIQPNFKTT